MRLLPLGEKDPFSHDITARSQGARNLNSGGARHPEQDDIKGRKEGGAIKAP